jgi:hypothetical protein
MTDGVHLDHHDQTPCHADERTFDPLHEPAVSCGLSASRRRGPAVQVLVPRVMVSYSSAKRVVSVTRCVLILAVRLEAA